MQYWKLCHQRTNATVTIKPYCPHAGEKRGKCGSRFLLQKPTHNNRQRRQKDLTTVRYIKIIQALQGCGPRWELVIARCKCQYSKEEVDYYSQRVCFRHRGV